MSLHFAASLVAPLHDQLSNSGIVTHICSQYFEWGTSVGSWAKNNGALKPSCFVKVLKHVKQICELFEAMHDSSSTLSSRLFVYIHLWSQADSQWPTQVCVHCWSQADSPPLNPNRPFGWRCDSYSMFSGPAVPTHQFRETVKHC